MRGDDPSPAIRHTRRKTMRHWITSFRLVDGSPNMEGFGAGCKRLSGACRAEGDARGAAATFQRVAPPRLQSLANSVQCKWLGKS